MGEVFRARDTPLGRDVAVKIPPPEMAHDPARSQRFEQEARAIAALNHPNIVAIYDVGEGYIVSELIDGDSLGQVKLGLRNTIDAGVRMAAGLAAAHAAGITHRDLKPGNIMLTRDGRVKILDFGLAKMTGPQTTGAAVATETITSATEYRIYYDRALDTPRGIYAVPVLGGEEQLVVENAMYPEALPDGSLIGARFNSEYKLQLFRIWPDGGREQALPMQVDLPTYSPQVRALPGDLERAGGGSRPVDGRSGRQRAAWADDGQVMASVMRLRAALDGWPRIAVPSRGWITALPVSSLGYYLAAELEAVVYTAT